MSPTRALVRLVAAVVLVMLLGVGLLYAFRAQTPAGATVPNQDAPFAGAGILFTLLALAVLLLLVLFAASMLARTRAGDTYERLERIANLRDRGVLSDDEFQREKRRLLK